MTTAKKSILLCLGTQKGLSVLEAAIPFRERHQFYVCTFEEKAVAEVYHDRIKDLASTNGCKLLSLNQFREGLLDFVIARQISSILCVGWRFLVPAEVVRALNGGLVVAHDSLLPRLRGFAPLPTAMIVGEQETGVTFLRAGDGIDDGDILWQDRVAIEPDDTIASLTEKTLPLYSEGARRVFHGDLKHPVPQDHAHATYSLWRDECDYRIDWSWDAEMIERVVRALGPPYLGAQCILGERAVTLHRAAVVPDLPFAIRQPGKVWSLDAMGRPTVVCGRGLLRIDEATAAGESIIPLQRLRVRFA